jgi:hypothetical protein
LDHLSVKPGPKRLNFYGQTAVFDHFVRNRHFSGGPITDKESIFIDVSVTTVILTNSVLCGNSSIAAPDLGYGQNVLFGICS